MLVDFLDLQSIGIISGVMLQIGNRSKDNTLSGGQSPCASRRIHFVASQAEESRLHWLDDALPKAKVTWLFFILPLSHSNMFKLYNNEGLRTVPWRRAGIAFSIRGQVKSSSRNKSTD